MHLTKHPEFTWDWVWEAWGFAPFERRAMDKRAPKFIKNRVGTHIGARRGAERRPCSREEGSSEGWSPIPSV